MRYFKIPLCRNSVRKVSDYSGSDDTCQWCLRSKIGYDNALSFFKAPSGIVSSIDSIFDKKIWGGSVDHKKITWIDWQSICRSQEVGGLEN